MTYNTTKGVNKQNLLLFFFALLAGQAFAQNLSRNNWYFGNSTTGIRFNRSTNAPETVTNKAIPFGAGGSAVATDPATANLFFYTDGVLVYDAYHLLMPGTGGLTGNTAANQPVAVSAIPGNKNKYFIFTNSADFTTGGSVSRLVIDMAQFGNAAFPAPARGTGEGTVAGVPGLSNRSEAMIVVPHSNGEDFWLLTHQVNSQNYAATLINAASYTGTFTTTITTIPLSTSPSVAPITAANFAYNEKLKKLVVSPQDPNTNAIILNFDTTTGVFSFDNVISNSGVNSSNQQSVYDTEWSPSGRFLYLSRFGDTGINADVLQYDLLNQTTTLASVLPSPVFRSYGLQLAPDSTIYHLYQASNGGPFLTGRITHPDSVAAKTAYATSLFSATDFKGTQFPGFAPPDTVDLKVNFTFIGTCQNSPTTFFPDVKPAADSLVWTFGDGRDTTAWSPIHTYAQAGTFNVQLKAFYQGQTDSVTLPVTITAFPLQLQLVQDTTACRDEFPPPRGSSSPTQFSVKVTASGGTPTSYTWSNGDIGQTLTPDSAGYYYVVVTDASGCSAYAGVNVKEYGLQDQIFNKWYFGNKAGIDFNFSPPKALSESAMDAPEGCAIVCDRNGTQIFYTDGDKVYNKNQVQIESGIGGDPASSQSAIIIPVTGDETLYYIFTTQAINGTSQNEVRYSLFDLKQNNGLGAVVKKNVLLFSKSTERLTANGQWLIVHEWGNNTFRTYSVSANGIGEPVFSSIGSDHTFTTQQNGEGYMKLGPRNNLAVALSTPGTSNLVELFQLNDSTGHIGNYRKIDLKEPSGQVYGIEFSPGGNKVFATVKGSPSPSKLFEYSIDSLEQPHFKQVINGTSEFGALQRGPDGQIYMAINGSTVLGTIAAVDDTTRLSSFNAAGFTLAGGTNSRLGLPNFIQINSNALGGPSINVAGVCTNDSTTISGTSRDVIDEFNWQVRQGSTVMATSTEESFKYLFTTAGVYTISLRLHNRCAADTTLTRNVTIFNPPADPSTAAPICTTAVTLDANPPNAPALTYLWSTGATTETIQVSQRGIVTVTVNDANSCTTNGSFMVVDNRPKLDLGPDITICQNENTPALNALNVGDTYQWTIDGINTSTTQTQPVTTSSAGVFTYAVRVTDPVTTCFIDESKTYTINASPSFSLTGVDPTGACGSATGSITLQINPTTPPTGPYSYFLSGPGTNLNGFDNVAPFVLTDPGKAAGTYSAVVSDQVSGCTISQSIGLTDGAIAVTATPKTPNCDPVIVNVATTGTAPLTYTITRGATIITGPTPQASTNFDASPGLGQGTYTVQINDNAGCIATSNVTITPDTPINVVLTPNICTAPATITASGDPATYSWTGPNITGGATSAIVQINPGQGQFTYTVIATPTGAGCPNTQDVTVDIDNAVTPVLTQSDACQNSVTLTVSPAGNYTYRWFRDGVFQPTLGGQVTTISDPAENGHTYGVTIVNTVNGCTYPTNNLVLQINGPINASLTSTPPCEDGQPFTLTAATTATGVTYAWFRNNTAIAGQTTSSITQTDNGTYRVDISKGSCTASSSLTIAKSPIPVGNLPDRVIICNDPDNKDETTNHVDLDPGAFVSYNWLQNDRALNYTDRVLTATLAGIYEVELTNTFACKAKDQTEVRNECIPKLVAPNAFRPNSNVVDNRNFFVLSFFITEDFEIFIYNRWGEMVFQSNDRHFKWNGGYNNSNAILPGGTYAYVIRYVSAFRPDLGKQEQRGGVSLLR